MSALANACRSPEHHIRVHEMAVIWFSGLRGAIALALAVEFPTATEVLGTLGEGNFCFQREHVVACTIIVVLVTVFVMGGLTKPVLTLCGVPMGPEATTLALRRPSRTTESRRRWKRALLWADQRMLRPVLVAEHEWYAHAPLQPDGSANAPELEMRDKRMGVGAGLGASPPAQSQDSPRPAVAQAPAAAQSAV
jgi:NhaP-type Na+/H+ or K+/H+ antiporter